MNKDRLLELIGKENHDISELNELIFLFESFIQEQFKTAMREGK